MNCTSCGRKCFGGTPARQAARLCFECWKGSIDQRLHESARRRKHFAGKRSLAELRPGARVQKVKIELFHNTTPPQYGEIVEAPVLVDGNNWEVAVRWDGRPRPERVNARRVQVIENACSASSPVH